MATICGICNNPLSGKQTKYCSKVCAVKGYQKNNREAYLLSQKKRHEKDKKQQPLQRVLHRLKNRAASKNIPFDLKVEDIIVPEKCPILGIELKWSTTGCNPNSPSVDRIDSKKGYTKDNIIVISNRANFLKRDASLEEMRAIVNFYEGLNV